MTAATLPQLHTSETAAAALGCTTERIEELARAGDLAGTKVGTGWLFLDEHILEFVRDRAIKEATERKARRVPSTPAMPVTPRPRGRPRLNQIPQL